MPQIAKECNSVKRSATFRYPRADTPNETARLYPLASPFNCARYRPAATVIAAAKLRAEPMMRPVMQMKLQRGFVTLNNTNRCAGNGGS